MIVRAVVVLAAMAFAYIGTVVAAFLYWDATGASGPDPTPLLVVLFAIAPLVSITVGILAIRRGSRSRAAPPPLAPAATVVGPPARRNGPLQIAIAVVGALIAGAVMLAIGHVPLTPHIVRMPTIIR